MKTYKQFTESTKDYEAISHTLQHHGWEVHSAGSGFAAYDHPKHPGHLIGVQYRGRGAGKWDHNHEDMDEPVATGKDHASFQAHLSSFHKKFS